MKELPSSLITVTFSLDKVATVLLESGATYLASSGVNSSNHGVALKSKFSFWTLPFVGFSKRTCPNFVQLAQNSFEPWESIVGATAL